MRTVVYNPQWYKAECDPAGVVEFQIQPLSNSMQSNISGNIPIIKKKGRRGRVEIDGGYMAIMLVRCGLVGIKGLKDSRTADKDEPENEELMKDLDLAFTEKKIGAEKVKVVRKEYLDLLPPDLFAEILDTIRGTTDLFSDDEDDEEGGELSEQDELDFTPDSAPQNGSSAETSTATET